MARNPRNSGKKKGDDAPVRWGVLSTAKIGTEKVIPGMMGSREIEIRAIASRTRPTAERWAKKLGIPVAYGSYEALLDDPEIEAIYNPLPNHLHIPLTLEAAKRGKHVLCEKPIALTAKEASKLLRVSEKVHIAEAYMVRHHPQWIRARQIVESGELGELRAIQALFSYHNVDPTNIRNLADIGGGTTYDIGGYPVVTARYIFGSEPVRVLALTDVDPAFGTDRTLSAIVDFGAGRHLTLTASTQAVPYQRVQILGTRARLEVVIPFNAPQGESVTLYLDRGRKLADASARAIRIPKADQYRLQGEAFSRAVRGREKLAFGVRDAITQMRVIDALFRSSSSGRWAKV
jgi:predicted dehydrogenase